MALLLAACTSPITHGIVRAKAHHDAYDSTWYMPIYRTDCQTYSGQTTCTQVLSYMLPVTDHHAEQWLLTVEQCEQECRTGDVEVTAAVWERTRVGDNWERPA